MTVAMSLSTIFAQHFMRISTKKMAVYNFILTLSTVIILHLHTYMPIDIAYSTGQIFL
jgi:hypothetical protein